MSQIGRCLGDANGYYEATFEAAQENLSANIEPSTSRLTVQG